MAWDPKPISKTTPRGKEPRGTWEPKPISKTTTPKQAPKKTT